MRQTAKRARRSITNPVAAQSSPGRPAVPARQPEAGTACPPGLLQTSAPTPPATSTSQVNRRTTPIAPAEAVHSRPSELNDHVRRADGVSLAQSTTEKGHDGSPQRDTSQRPRPGVKRHDLRGTRSLPKQARHRRHRRQAGHLRLQDHRPDLEEDQTCRNRRGRHRRLHRTGRATAGTRGPPPRRPDRAHPVPEGTARRPGRSAPRHERPTAQHAHPDRGALHHRRTRTGG